MLHKYLNGISSYCCAFNSASDGSIEICFGFNYSLKYIVSCTVRCHRLHGIICNVFIHSVEETGKSRHYKGFLSHSLCDFKF